MIHCYSKWMQFGPNLEVFDPFQYSWACFAKSEISANMHLFLMFFPDTEYVNVQNWYYFPKHYESVTTAFVQKNDCQLFKKPKVSNWSLTEDLRSKIRKRHEARLKVMKVHLNLYCNWKFRSFYFYVLRLIFLQMKPKAVLKKEKNAGRLV